MSNDPFEKLMIENTQTTNQEELANLLEPYVLFVKETKEIDFKPEFHGLADNKLKILVILAAFKAKSIVFKTEEKVSPKTIIDLDLMPEGSVKATIKLLCDSKEIKSENQKYYLPGYRIMVLANRLSTRSLKKGE